jgi:hypothetical protein
MKKKVFYRGKIKKNGRKISKKQNYLCKTYGRQFIGDHALQYKGRHFGLTQKILMMPVRGTGIRAIAAIEKISIKKVLSTPVRSRHPLQAEQQYYDGLEMDGLWTYVSRKSRKVCLLYAYHRETGEIVAFVWGKRDLKTARKLKKKLSDSGVTCGSITTDDRDSFILCAV